MEDPLLIHSIYTQRRIFQILSLHQTPAGFIAQDY